MIGEAGDLLDIEHDFVDAYGLNQGEWILVRPDGYIAAIVEELHIGRLAAHFDAINVG